MQMVLMAESLGLGTCFCGFLNSTANSHPELKKMLQIPEKNDVILSFTLGYPSVKYLRMVPRNPAEVSFL